MNSHFCKVGKTRAYIGPVFNLKDLENKYARFIEEAYNLEQTDMSLSDILFYEAHKLKLSITKLRNSGSKSLDAAF